MNYLDLAKCFIKKIKAYQLLEHWITHTYMGVKIFSLFIGVYARKSGLHLNTESSPAGLKLIVSKDHQLIKISARHFVYLQDIVDNFDYYYNAVQPEISQNNSVVDYSVARQHILKPSGIPFFFSSFAEPFETTEIYLQKGNLKEGDTVFDLGSYCGSTVWGFSKAVGKSGMVYAFEPDPVNYEMLCKNVKHHELLNVITINKGVWSSDGIVLFQSEGNMGSGISELQGRDASLLRVSVISLETFCSEHKIERIDYIKMDIEGAEVEILKTAGRILEKYHPRLIIEPHFVKTKVVTEEICKILSINNYHTEIIPQAGLPLPLIYTFPLNGDNVS